MKSLIKIIKEELLKEAGWVLNTRYYKEGEPLPIIEFWQAPNSNFLHMAAKEVVYDEDPEFVEHLMNFIKEQFEHYLGDNIVNVFDMQKLKPHMYVSYFKFELKKGIPKTIARNILQNAINRYRAVGSKFGEKSKLIITKESIVIKNSKKHKLLSNYVSK